MTEKNKEATAASHCMCLESAHFWKDNAFSTTIFSKHKPYHVHFLGYTATHHGFQKNFLKIIWEAVHDLKLLTHSSFRFQRSLYHANNVLATQDFPNAPSMSLLPLYFFFLCNFPRFTFFTTCTFPIYFQNSTHRKLHPENFSHHSPTS